MESLTPVYISKEGIFVKRDDLFAYCGLNGGKVRTCAHLVKKCKKGGIVTASHRKSPQIQITARLSKEAGIPCFVHTASGAFTNEMKSAREDGAVIIQHIAGYNSVIIARAKAHAKKDKLYYLPFGMECQEAVTQTRKQVKNIPEGVKRIVMPIGSGMSLCGVLNGLRDYGKFIDVLGVIVGANPLKRLHAYMPVFGAAMFTLAHAGVPYAEAIEEHIDGIVLDPIYEAKCAKFLRRGDLLWIIGKRDM